MIYTYMYLIVLNYECIMNIIILLLYFLYSKAQERLISQTMSNIKYSVDLEGSVRENCDLLIEAIVENLAVKQEMFAKLDKIAPRCVSVIKVELKLRLL